VKDDLFKYSTESKLIGSAERSAESDDWDLIPLRRAVSVSEMVMSR
jgi:hypothetical protein